MGVDDAVDCLHGMDRRLPDNHVPASYYNNVVPGVCVGGSIEKGVSE